MPSYDTPDSIPTKQCYKCREWKQATTEYFPRNKNLRDGFNRCCKICMKAYYAANREKIIARARAHYNANREHRLETARAYRDSHREKISEYKRIYQHANREKLNAISRAYYAANKERILSSIPWRIKNRDAYRVWNRRRKALKRNASGTHTVADIKRQYDAQKGKCYYCGVKVSDTYHVDHVVPLSRGGSNGPENLVIACPQCNISKKNKMPHEWPQGGRLL